tara:strand:+ start:327 stop:542 length:216 start_codon:yes stop_codon:yes gene_type:complete
VVLAFLLVVIVSGETVSDDRMLFRNIYRCNEFALAIEESRIGPRNKRYTRNKNVTAYCIPRMVNENTFLFE